MADIMRRSVTNIDADDDEGIGSDNKRLSRRELQEIERKRMKNKKQKEQKKRRGNKKNEAIVETSVNNAIDKRNDDSGEMSLQLMFIYL
jgi:hypothetical protein